MVGTYTRRDIHTEENLSANLELGSQIHNALHNLGKLKWITRYVRPYI